jgi:glycosyltransferase involved in cell wall biosynthesis
VTGARPPADLSFVVPCYNEAANLPKLFEKLIHGLPADLTVEVILVDNGSTDDTARVLRELLPRCASARSVRVPVNKGYGYGILAGLRETRADVIGWTHADLQTDPADVVDGFRQLRARPDWQRLVLKGRRVGRPLFDRLFTHGMSAVASAALGIRVSDVNAQPKLFPRALLGAMGEAPHDFSLDLYLLWLAHTTGHLVIEHPVEFGKRVHGEAKGGASLRGKWRLTRRTLQFILKLRRRIRAASPGGGM